MSENSAKERRAKLLELRKSGMTYREIGERMGFSAQCARQLVYLAQRDIRDQEKYERWLRETEGERAQKLLLDKTISPLSTRARNILRRYGVDSAEALGSIDPEKLRNTRNCGQKTFDEIMHFLGVEL